MRSDSNTEPLRIFRQTIIETIKVSYLKDRKGPFHSWLDRIFKPTYASNIYWGEDSDWFEYNNECEDSDDWGIQNARLEYNKKNKKMSALLMGTLILAQLNEDPFTRAFRNKGLGTEQDGNSLNYQGSPLAIASFLGDFDMVSLLIRDSVKPSALEDQGL